MSIFRESGCDRTQVWGQKRVPLNTKFTLAVLKSAWSSLGLLAIGSTILFSSLNVAQASNVATSSLGGINGTSATQGANNSVSTPAKKMSVGASMAREMFPSAMEDEENTLGDESLEDPLALVHDRAALERNAQVPRSYNEVKQFNRDWFKTNKEICFVAPVSSLHGAYCMQDRIRELENMYLAKTNAKWKDSCFYVNTSDKSNHTSKCYFYGELTACLEQTRPFNCMENVIATEIADLDIGETQARTTKTTLKAPKSTSLTTKIATEEVSYFCQGPKGYMALQATFWGSEMPTVCLVEFSGFYLNSEVALEKVQTISQAECASMQPRTLYMYPENRGAFYSESIFKALKHNTTGLRFTESKDGAFYTDAKGQKYTCTFLSPKDQLKLKQVEQKCHQSLVEDGSKKVSQDAIQEASNEAS